MATAQQTSSVVCDSDKNSVSYPDGPTLTYLWSEEPLVGQSLYLGGEEGPDRQIYCIPGHAPRVLVIDTLTDRVYPIGPRFEGKFKWLRGVVCGDVIYGLPCHADSVLRIHVPTQTVTTIQIPYNEFYNDDSQCQLQKKMNWKYHGGTICPLDGCIYAIPQSAWHVLKIDPSTETCSLVGPALKGRYKWYGGIVGKTDGAIYGIPHNSPSVLRIDPTDITLHGDFGPGGHKWHGAAAAHDGTIVSVPANANTVLCVVPGRTPQLLQLGNESIIKTGRHRSDGKYKYLGAMACENKVYCFPSGAERVLQIDTTRREVCEVGENLVQLERLHQNKWQNGLVCDGSVYAIPLAAETVLQICGEQIKTFALPTPCKGLAKWEGGVLASNGVMYCVPNNHKAVLRISTNNHKEKQQPQGEQEAVSTPNGGETLPKQDVESKDAANSAFQNQNGVAHETCSTPNGEERMQNPIDGQHSEYVYKTGLATLRSSAHRVKAPLKNRKHNPKPRDREGRETNRTLLPDEICRQETFSYDTSRYDFHGAIRNLLVKCDSDIVGSFRQDENGKTSTELEDFCVPPKSLSRSSYGGQCESAQVYLSNAVASDQAFLEVFDDFVMQHVLLHLKQRLVAFDVVTDEPITFYYQRPPTLRLQPGPSQSIVRAHNDAEYGHQNGELNFWMPLTGLKTGVHLQCESSQGKGDYLSLVSTYGEVVSFHGSSCRHYVDANKTKYTRVSLDFRVGVEGYFDLSWQMHGTSNDHDRREVRI